MVGGPGDDVFEFFGSDFEAGEIRDFTKGEDKIIRMPDNPYTAAMNSHKELLATAKAARRGEAVRELYVSGALIDVDDKAGRVDHEK